MNNLYFVRHGDYRHSDGSLTERGVAQSEKIGRYLAGRDRKYIILTSPYTRAKETANIIASHVNHLDVIEMALLKEHFPGEPYNELQDRAIIAYRVMPVIANYDVIAVSHRAVLRVILSPLLHKEPKEIKIDKGMVYEFSNKNGKVRYEDRWGA